MKINDLKIGVLVLFLSIFYSCTRKESGPFLATGIKIGEVTQTTAIVWVRLTENSERIGNDAPMPDFKYEDPETGEMEERKGRPDITPVVTTRSTPFKAQLTEAMEMSA